VLYQVNDRWRLRGGYSYLHKDLHTKPGSEDLNGASAESNDPHHQAMLQSTFNLGDKVEFDLVSRAVGALSRPDLPAYVGLDVRLGWRPIRQLDVSLTGQNLLKSLHREFIADTPARQINRGVSLKLVWH
jgi:iron complex outermembrane receptor protein